jgi:hypothetical protein
MKKLILAIVLATMASTAVAQHNGHRGRYNGGGYQNQYHGNQYRGGWVAPAVGALVLGGIVGAALAQPYYAPAPVYAQPAPVYVNPSVPYGYRYVQILDANCNCYQTVLVPN